MSSVVTDRVEIEKVLDNRGIEKIYPSKEEVTKRFQEGERLSFYIGIDPTGPDIHLGHTTNFFLLKDIIKLGHKVIILIGDFTAKIGDPTDRVDGRRQLNDEEIRKNMKTYLTQVNKILPRNSFSIKYNNYWLGKLTFSDVVELASRVTVGQMMARDMFKKRVKEKKPIGLHEFLYPLMQGYDSVAMNVDGEIGGTDQTFNMLMGRDLVKQILNKNKIVITTKLLEDPKTGKKIMSKSEGRYISLNDSSGDMFGKVMSGIQDQMIQTVFNLATEVDLEKIKELKTLPPKEFKEALARELVRMYHGEEGANKAKEEFNNIFSKGNLPSEIDEIRVGADEINITDIMVNNNIVSSKSEAKRLIDQKGVSVNEIIIENWDQKIKIEDDAVLKVGPRRFYRLRVN